MVNNKITRNANATLLNFLFPGVGYVYLKKYVWWGILIFALYTLTSLDIIFEQNANYNTIEYILSDLVLCLAFAWHAYMISKED